MRKPLFLTLLLSLILSFARADGGMWIPLYLSQNEAEMQQLGFHLTADDIYSINHNSMKDAIVLFGSGCTAELISSKGLLLTNHHCGYSYVQSHSTMEHNYLQDGFWAKSMTEEIPMEGLTVTFLVYMEDVTEQVLAGVTDQTKEADRQATVKENIAKVTKKATDGTGYNAIIKPFYYGNQYFMFVTETYNDIRRMMAMGENFVKLENPKNSSKFPLRYAYGADDTTTNPNVEAAFGNGQYVFSEPVWWAGGSR